MEHPLNWKFNINRDRFDNVRYNESLLTGLTFIQDNYLNDPKKVREPLKISHTVYPK